MENRFASILEGVSRVSAEDFGADPACPGGVRIVNSPTLYESLSALSRCPAAWGESPTDAHFNTLALNLGAMVRDELQLDVIPHCIFASTLERHRWDIHTDWEGSTFADPGTFTIWAPLSHIGEPGLLLFKCNVWPSPNFEFKLDETGLYGRTMFLNGAYCRYAEISELGILEVALEKGEIILFNNSVPHMTHPSSAKTRRAINVRCPRNLATKRGKKVRVNLTAPYSRIYLPYVDKTSSKVSDLVYEVDANVTPKGYCGMASILSYMKLWAKISHRLQPVVRFLSKWPPFRK